MLTVHVICSIGWIGAAAGYLSLGVAAQTSGDPETVQAAWIAMALSGWVIIVPFGCLAFVTGIVMSVGTRWGLVRHYWVVIALVLTTLSLAILLLHMPTVITMEQLARKADDAAVLQQGGDIVQPGLGLIVLLVIAVLNMFKPRGLTRYGRRKQADERYRSGSGAAGIKT
jgi:uncharacterized membrane protein